MKNFKKGFGRAILLIILGLIVIVGGGAYWYMQNQKDTTIDLYPPYSPTSQTTINSPVSTPAASTPTGTKKVSDQLGFYTLQLPNSWVQTEPLPGKTESLSLPISYAASNDPTSPNVLITINEESLSTFESNFSPNATGVKYVASHSQNFNQSTVSIGGAQKAYAEESDIDQKHYFQINAYGKTHIYTVGGSWTNPEDGSVVKGIINSLILTDH